jgi:hypothetical protein
MHCHSLIIQHDMQHSKRVKLCAAPHTRQLPAAVIHKVMGYYKDLLVPGIQFGKYRKELQWRAQQFQERLHYHLDCNTCDVPDECYCAFENASDFLLMCYCDTIDGYTPGGLACHHCCQWREQAAVEATTH